jgi:hypothetical protein
VTPKGIYGGFETGIMPPVVVKQTLPAFPRDLVRGTTTASWNLSSARRALWSLP